MTKTEQMLAAISDRLAQIEATIAAPVIVAPDPAIAEIVDAPPAPAAPAHNALVDVRVLTLLHYDGDPATEGAEVYAPEGFEFSEEQRHGLYDHGLDDNDIAFLPDQLRVTRIVADAFVKAGIAQILNEQGNN